VTTRLGSVIDEGGREGRWDRRREAEIDTYMYKLLFHTFLAVIEHE